MNKMKVYSFLYNPMIEESAHATISIHRTRKGAEKAMKCHKEKQYKKWRKIYPTKNEEPFRFGYFEDWCIVETEIVE